MSDGQRIGAPSDYVEKGAIWGHPDAPPVFLLGGRVQSGEENVGHGG